ncbi:hypothetical protein [Nocardioides sp. YIM 152588]|uniref:hypothetical protein n=1 Tax=Nocardioides sp. YIM 152588 TaxID=3158259 RepID=UPI0032E3A308
MPSPAWSPRQLAILTLADAIADLRPLTEEEARRVGEGLDDVDRVEVLSRRRGLQRPRHPSRAGHAPRMPDRA